MRDILHQIGLFLTLCLLFSCGGNGHDGPAEALEGDEIATMITHDVTMLISDSGIIKYRAITPTWVRFGEEAKEPYQYFPDGIEFEQIDTVFEATETIVADTAYNWEDKQLWHLIKNVRVTSVKGEKFFTNDLYWDMRSHKVYSDSFIHIERMENIIEGYGFTSNDNFSKYEIKQTNGIFPVQENEEGAAQDSTSQGTAPAKSKTLSADVQRQRNQQPETAKSETAKPDTLPGPKLSRGKIRRKLNVEEELPAKSTDASQPLQLAPKH